MAVLEHPEVRQEAVNVALRSLDGTADEFLVRAIHADPPLPYIARHRVLAHLRRDRKSAAQIDTHRQLVLDLQQASRAPHPCAAFEEALASMEAAPDPAFAEALEQAEPPKQAPGSRDCRASLELRRRALSGVLDAALASAP